MGIRYYKENSEPINVNNTNPVGYYDNASGQKTLMRNVINAAIDNDIYVIVDWHSHNAENETSLATTFFREMATEYRNVPNIIWEIYNEPVGASASTITTYSNSVIKAIRDAGNQNLVLIGSNFYSQKPNEQASSYGTASKAQTDNVAFTFHFYANTHPHSTTSGIGGAAASAMTNGYAVFGTEWGTVNADGDGSPNTGASNSWVTWMDGQKISSCMWSASTMGGGSAMFSSGTTAATMSTSRFTANGNYFQTYMNSNRWTAQIPSGHPRCNNATGTVKDGNSVTLSSSTLGVTGDITEIGSLSSGEVTISSDKKSFTYRTADRGSADDQVKFIYKVTQGSVTVQCKAVISITDRRPFLPDKGTIAVSRRAPTALDLMRTLSAVDPSSSGLELTNVTVSPSSVGTVSITDRFKDTVMFTPASSQYDVESAEATLTYTVRTKATSATNTASVILRLRNMAPTITPITNTTCCQLTSVPNTEPKGINIRNFNGRDVDNDPIWFDQIYLHSQYPGRLEKVTNDSFVYYPEAGKIGKVVFLAVITDGTAKSLVGRANMTLTGSGSSIGDLPPPTEIPGYIEPDPCEVDPFSCNASIIPGYSGSFGLKSLGSGRVELSFAQSGHAKLDVYSLSGKYIGSLLNGWQNAGSNEVSLKNLNLQKGVYILRLKQGSQIKTVRIVN